MLGACTSIDSGEVGITKVYGAVGEQALEPGLHWYNVFTTSIETMNVQSQRWNNSTAAYTKDLQTAEVAFTLVYRLDRAAVINVRRTVGHDWQPRLIPAVVQSTVKNVFGRYDAMRAIEKRPEIQQRIYGEIRQRLAARGIIVESFELTNIDYSDAFESAVEQAQVATQQAVAARNKTVRIQEEARQTVITETARAEATRIQANAIATNPEILRLRWIEKWSGQLPQTVYCSAQTPCVSTQ